MEVISKIEENTLYLNLAGRIDANTAPEFEKVVNENVKGVEKIVINAEKLEYISSAGLRVILKCKKLVPDTSVVEASPESYDIFEMTGFAEMMSITKRFRQLDVEGCPIIGKGYYGTVYRLNKDTIVKVYSHKMTLDRINNERELARKAFVLGVPTAISYDVVKVGDQYGSVFELLDAETLQEKIIKHPENIGEYCKQSIAVLKTIHSCKVKPGELDNKKDEVLGWVDHVETMVPRKVGKRIRELVEGIEEVNTVLHGDYHIKNVMMANEDPMLIDMDTLSMGSPIFELGFMYSSYVGYQEIDHSNSMAFFGIEHDVLVKFFHKSMELYFEGKSPEYIEMMIKKARILCYIQLIDRFDKYADHPELLERFKTEIAELVFEVEDLNI